MRVMLAPMRGMGSVQLSPEPLWCCSGKVQVAVSRFVQTLSQGNNRFSSLDSVWHRVLLGGSVVCFSLWNSFVSLWAPP